MQCVYKTRSITNFLRPRLRPGANRLYRRSKKTKCSKDRLLDKLASLKQCLQAAFSLLFSNFLRNVLRNRNFDKQRREIE